MSSTTVQATSSSTTTENIDVIVTSCGGEDMPKAAYRGGALLGISSRKKPPEDIAVEFIDWPFLDDEPSFETHLDVVKHEEPRLAVAPDIEDEADFDATIAQADRLNQYADTVIVVPKGVKPDRIPSRFRVGLPAQERFGGNPWPVWEYRNCDSVHILGGSPNTQFELAHYAEIKSVDTASPLKAAQFGSVWNGKWSEEGHNYYDRIERSMHNLVQKWGEDVCEERLNRRRREVQQPDPCPVPEERVARPPSRDELCIGENEDHPFPGRAYFYRDDTLSYSEYKQEYA